MQTLSTRSTKASSIKRVWHLIDVKDKVLGRVATGIAKLLMGKAKPYFVRHLDCGDYVIIINAKHIKVTGKKESDKKYFTYSGFPGGLHVRTLANFRLQKPEEIIVHAVKGMLPQNKLRDRMLSRLFVFPEAEHPYQDKIKN
ncbi:MAG: 50S ribosomal protein L13 [Candidatus Levybacteria bacterium]|nr:50S ribosomal protein L13 [Candidatus Levybacteria bacterium]